MHKMIADISSNKIFNQVVTELFIRGRKLNIFTVFITQTHFSVPKDIRLNHTHFFIMKIPNNMAMNGIKISVKIKNKDCLNIEKNILK